MKVVINRCHGGFAISLEAAKFMAARGNERAKRELEIFHQTKDDDRWYGYGHIDKPWPQDKGGHEYYRADPDLIAAVETLGEKADGNLAKLEIVEIPDDVCWEIEEHAGVEWIAEEHSTWR